MHAGKYSLQTILCEIFHTLQNLADFRVYAYVYLYNADVDLNCNILNMKIPLFQSDLWGENRVSKDHWPTLFIF